MSGDHRGWQGGVAYHTACVAVTDNTRISGQRCETQHSQATVRKKQAIVQRKKQAISQ